MKHQTFGDMLKRLRQARGLSAYALATRAGLPRQTVSSLERDGGQPSWLTVQLLALALEVETDSLRDRTLRLPTPEPRNPVGRPPKPKGE